MDKQEIFPDGTVIAQVVLRYNNTRIKRFG